jgi:type VI secretion system protein ImpH
MAPQSRRTDPSLERLLFEEAYRFDFFQAVRVLERLYVDRKPVGQDVDPSQEVVRFRSRLSLSFPPSALYEIARRAHSSGPVEMTVSFMGLTGPLGVLPRHYTELLLERVRNKDLALRDFLDLFNHRFISLFYRAWEKYRLPIAYERAALDREGYDCFSLCLFDLIGMGTKGLRGRLEVEDDALLFYAGLLTQHPRSASALASLLQDYFGVPVEVIQMTGQWLLLTQENRSRLGPSEANNALGVSTVLGGRVWDQQAQFTLRVGPLAFPTFCQFLPSGSAFRSLVQLTRYFVGQECDFDIQLVLKAAAVPWCRLGETGDHAPRLGWSSWLKTGEFTHDAGDAVLASHLRYTRPQRQGASTGSGEGQYAREPKASDWQIERYVPQRA